MVRGKRRTIVPERRTVRCSANETSRLFTSYGYRWHLYILDVIENDGFWEHSDGYFNMKDYWNSYKVEKKCISFKYEGLTCKVDDRDADTDRIVIRYDANYAEIVVRFGRVLTIEEIAHIIEWEVMPNVQKLKRTIRSGVEEIDRGMLGFDFGIISPFKRAM